MKFSEYWLRSIVDPDLTSPELADLLTMAGLEVEERVPVAPTFDHVVVGCVTTLGPHPNADRLRLCSVDIGSDSLQIVCGAPNVRVGMKVACALVGARLPNLTIAKAKVRGVESLGMLCSAQELGLEAPQDGLLELDMDAPLGADVRALLDLGDFVLTLKLTPNRGDCLSIRGLGREVSALTGVQARWRDWPVIAAQTSEQRGVELEAGDACPRYCGRVIRGLDTAARTPSWIVRRLERSGVRPISAVVDITNYVMLESGQPLHAFDLDRLQGRVHVRFAQSGEHLLLLNGSEIELAPTHLVIADDAQPLALAGVMGGEASSVSAATQAVFLESAYFAPDVIAQGARGLELASDAAHRFERGVDFALTRDVMERATELVLQVCGGAAGPTTEALCNLPQRHTIELRSERVRRLLGIEVDPEYVVAALRRLGLEVSMHSGVLRVTPPSFRFDLAIEEDLIEEIARVYGFERITASLPQARLPMLPLPETRLSVYGVKQALAARDYFEVVTFSFVERRLEEDFADSPNPIALANPIAAQMSVMRSTLLGSLVECVRFNVAHKQDRVRVFEVAACYSYDANEIHQVDRLAGVCYGPGIPEQWGMPAHPVDFFDVRGDLQAVFGTDRLRFDRGSHPAFHPGQCARVLLDGNAIGWLGALHPRLAQGYELTSGCVAFELELAAACSAPLPRYAMVSRFPPVRRDIAVFVDEDIVADDLVSTMCDAGRPLVTNVALFDVYRGKGVPEGRKSLAFRVLLQDTEKTLTDAEVEAVIQQLISILEHKHVATIRS